MIVEIDAFYYCAAELLQLQHLFVTTTEFS